MRESFVSFDCAGDVLAGILHEPASMLTSPIGVVIVVGGPQYRVGSHRQFVLMARRMAAAGYFVFRFDYRGMGDSTGVVRTFEDVAEDIRCAIDRFTSTVPGMRRVALFGLCDAASAILMYGSSDERVVALALANPWVRTSEGEARSYARHYFLQRVLQRSFWAKVWAGEFAWRESLNDLVALVHRMRRNEAQSVATAGGYIAAMERGLATQRGPVLIMTSDRDLTAREFEDHCERSAAWRVLVRRPNVQRSGIAGADHTFSSAPALASATSLLINWLNLMSKGHTTVP